MAAARPLPPWAWLASGVAALLALLFACRGAPLGVAIADDHAFLATLRFQHPLKLFDSMGAAFYWRPMSRQLWFGPWRAVIESHPAVIVAIHLVLLLALYETLRRILSRWLPPPAAALVALFPLLAEPARVLVTWPSGAQHLLAMLGVALAVHQALAGRLVSGMIAAAAAILSHESAVLAVPLLPWAAHLGDRAGKRARVWIPAAGALLLLWGLAYGIARHRGVQLPDVAPSAMWLGLPRALELAVRAALNLEDASPELAAVLLGAHVLLVLIAGVMLLRAPRTRRRDTLVAVAVGAGVFVAGCASLAALLPDWNAWRASLPALALGLGAGVLLARGHVALAGAFVALRLIALLAAPPAPTSVTKSVPVTTSDFSFVRLARMQRVVREVHETIVELRPTLPRAARIGFWYLPERTEIGLQHGDAVRSWLRDSTIEWRRFGAAGDFDHLPDVVLAFTPGPDPRPPMVVARPLLQLYDEAAKAFERPRESDSLFVLALAAQPNMAPIVRATLLRNRAWLACANARWSAADTLNAEAIRLWGPHPDGMALNALLASARGDTISARRLIRQSLGLDPLNDRARQIARLLRERTP